MVAQMALKIGMAALSIPVTDESIQSCAMGKMINGIAIQIAPRTAIRKRCSGSIGALDRGMSESVAAPRPTRTSVITPGRNASSPTSMNRNDDPQMTAMATSRPHSEEPNASRFVPVAVAGSELDEVFRSFAIYEAYDQRCRELARDAFKKGLTPLTLYPALMPRYASVLVCLTFVIAACTPGGDATTTTNALPTPSTTTSTVNSPPDGFGGTLTIGIDVAPTTLNPFGPNGSGSTRIVGNAVWATVYDIDPVTWERIPDNVTALPSSFDGGIKTNADGTMTVQYQVARRATWSDGVPMTGADLAFTAEAMRDLALAGNPTVNPIMASLVGTDSLEQIAWVTFAEPTLVFEDALWIILPSHVLSGADISSSDATEWPSGGPFTVDSDDAMSFVRNPNYWKSDSEGKQLPYADSISFVPFGDDALSPFEDRDVDVTVIPSAADTVRRMGDLADEGAEMQIAATAFVEHITFNLGPGREAANEQSFNDSYVFRSAIARSIDGESILVSLDIPWISTSPGVLVPHGPSAWDQYPYDPTAARSLVSSLEATVEPVSVLSTTANSEERPLIAAELGSAFAPIGVAYETNLVDSLVLFNDLLPSGNYDLGMWAWENDGGYESTLALLELLQPGGAPGSTMIWHASEDATARYIDLVSEARSTSAPSVFSSTVREAEEILASELPLIPLFHRASQAAVWTDTVTGVTHNGSESGLTWNVELWQVVGE